MADIELVIRIPEEIYKASQILDVKYEDTVQIPLEVIANGTFLPKGHGRLIDVDELLESKIQIIDEVGTVMDVVEIDMIDDTQTIIEADKEARS